MLKLFCLQRADKQHLALFLVLTLCFTCRAEDLKNKGKTLIDGDGPAESWDDDARAPHPRTASEEVHPRAGASQGLLD